jgi:uncharacterized membrane protein
VSLNVVSEITINRPIDVVAAYASNPNNAPTWYVNIKSVEWRTEPPLTVGSQVAFVAEFMRRRLAYTYEFVELSPDSRLVMRTAQGPFPMETTYTWERVGDGVTRMTLRNRGNPTGFSKLVAPFMKYGVRRANRKDLALLKSILESSGEMP